MARAKENFNVKQLGQVEFFFFCMPCPVSLGGVNVKVTAGSALVLAGNSYSLRSALTTKVNQDNPRKG